MRVKRKMTVRRIGWLLLTQALLIAPANGQQDESFQWSFEGEPQTYQLDCPAIITAIAPLSSSSVLVGSQSGIVEIAWPSGRASRVFNSRLIQVESLTTVSMDPSSDSPTHFVAVGGVPGESGSLEVWDISDVAMTERLAVHDDVITGLAVDAHVDLNSTIRWTFRTTAIDGSVRFQIANETLTLREHSAAVLAIADFPNEQFTVTAGRDQTLRVWDRPNRTLDTHTQ